MYWMVFEYIKRRMTFGNGPPKVAVTSPANPVNVTVDVPYTNGH